MIELNHFSFSYIENRIILDNLNFHIQKGEKVGLIGCNGAGKSTLLKTIIGIENGQGELKITDLTMNNQNLASIRSHIGYVFQDSDNQLFMSSVYEDVAFGPMNEGLQGEELEERINKALDLVHMQEKKHEKIYRLSGGDRVLLLSNGKLVADGPTQDILTNKKLLEENGLELPLSFSRQKSI